MIGIILGTILAIIKVILIILLIIAAIILFILICPIMYQCHAIYHDNADIDARFCYLLGIIRGRATYKNRLKVKIKILFFDIISIGYDDKKDISSSDDNINTDIDIDANVNQNIDQNINQNTNINEQDDNEDIASYSNIEYHAKSKDINHEEDIEKKKAKKSKKSLKERLLLLNDKKDKQFSKYITI